MWSLFFWLPFNTAFPSWNESMSADQSYWLNISLHLLESPCWWNFLCWWRQSNFFRIFHANHRVVLFPWQKNRKNRSHVNIELAGDFNFEKKSLKIFVWKFHAKLNVKLLWKFSVKCFQFTINLRRKLRSKNKKPAGW